MSCSPGQPHRQKVCSRAARLRGWLFLAPLVAVALSGCAGLHSLHGVPVNYYPQELRGETRSGKRTIDLSLLRQTPPDQYLLDTGDVLAIYIEGVLPRKDAEVPPVHFPAPGETTTPSIGFPIPVREDGTIALPLIRPILVRGATMVETEDAIRKAYTVDQQILNAGQDRIFASLQKPRAYNVLVIRQESGSSEQRSVMVGRTMNLGSEKRGTGKTVALPAYKNDVLHALAETGGLPGLDAENTVYVVRHRKAIASKNRNGGRAVSRRALGRRGAIAQASGIRRTQAASDDEDMDQGASGTQPAAPWGHAPLVPGAPAGPGHAPPNSIGGRQNPALPWYPPDSSGGGQPLDPGAGYPGLPNDLRQFGPGTQIIRIPIRLHPGEVPQFNEGDIILEDGDIVFIESRETEIFYTGGLLGGGQYLLPRDYDLDVLGAISLATATQNGAQSGAGFGNRIGGVAATNQDISVGASDVVILRQLPDGNQVPIKIDLNKALRDPKHRIRILPGDYVLLRYKPMEAVGAFIERNILAGGLLGLAASNFAGGTGGR